jgi:hypothetical protein
VLLLGRSAGSRWLVPGCGGNRRLERQLLTGSDARNGARGPARFLVDAGEQIESLVREQAFRSVSQEIEEAALRCIELAQPIASLSDLEKQVGMGAQSISIR